MVTYEWSDWRRNGIFSALYRHVESLAAAEPEMIGLRLYVEENNKQNQSGDS
jgi:ribosomal protein S18 acetylase RimI-like enzyme